MLAELGLLDDDTTPAIHSWIDGNTDSLAPGFAEPVRRWLITLIDGDARSKPRTAASAYAYLGSVRPFLEHWATRYGHLRESPRTTSTPASIHCTATGATTPSAPCGRCSGSPRNVG